MPIEDPSAAALPGTDLRTRCTDLVRRVCAFLGNRFATADRQTWGRAALAGGAALGATVIIYLSWMSDPSLSVLPWIPAWLGSWADSHGTMRTAVPFVLLSLCLGGWLDIRRSPRRCWAIASASLLGLLILAEFGQLFLPARTFDWRDIAWGVAGSALGFAAVGAVRLVRWGTSKIGRSVSNVEGRR